MKVRSNKIYFIGENGFKLQSPIINSFLKGTVIKQAGMFCLLNFILTFQIGANQRAQPYSQQSGLQFCMYFSLYSEEQLVIQL